jgi:UDP:flavonoid glycosyltransferase YjiC (YdhE family)
VFRHHASAFNRLRKSFGLRPLGGLKEIYTHGTWTLYTDIPSVAPTKDIPPHHRYIGPVIWSPAINLPDWWKDLSGDRPIIYVTMGSSGDIRLLDTILEVLRDMPVVGVVATAGRKTVIQKFANVYIAEYLPGVEVTGRSSVVICSGGSATAYQALSMGRPVLGFPSNADQFFTMESVQRLGAGISVRPMAASSENVKNALKTILGDVRYKEAAERLKQEIVHYDAGKLFPDFIDQWAEGRIPTKS